MKHDYYEILGVGENSSLDIIKKAYHKLALQWHPDRRPNDNRATAKFQLIQEAYAVLSDPKKKSQYDRSRFTSQTPFNAQNPFKSSPFFPSRDTFTHRPSSNTAGNEFKNAGSNRRHDDSWFARGERSRQQQKPFASSQARPTKKPFFYTEATDPDEESFNEKSAQFRKQQEQQQSSSNARTFAYERQESWDSKCKNWTRQQSEQAWGSTRPPKNPFTYPEATDPEEESFNAKSARFRSQQEQQQPSRNARGSFFQPKESWNSKCGRWTKEQSQQAPGSSRGAKYQSAFTGSTYSNEESWNSNDAGGGRKREQKQAPGSDRATSSETKHDRSWKDIETLRQGRTAILRQLTHRKETLPRMLRERREACKRGFHGLSDSSFREHGDRDISISIKTFRGDIANITRLSEQILEIMMEDRKMDARSGGLDNFVNDMIERDRKDVMDLERWIDRFEEEVRELLHEEFRSKFNHRFSGERRSHW